MNRGCGKPHETFMSFGKRGLKDGWVKFNDLPKREQKEYFDHPEKYLIVTEDGTPHWAKKDGSVGEEIYSSSERRYDERMAKRNWLQKILNL